MCLTAAVLLSVAGARLMLSKLHDETLRHGGPPLVEGF